MKDAQRVNPIRQELLELLQRIVRPGNLKYQNEELLKHMVDISVYNLRDHARKAHREGAEEILDLIVSWDPENAHVRTYVAKLRQVWEQNHQYSSEGMWEKPNGSKQQR